MTLISKVLSMPQLQMNVVSVFSIKTSWPKSFASLRMFAMRSMTQGAKGWIPAEVFQRLAVCGAGLCAGCCVSTHPTRLCKVS